MRLPAVTALVLPCGPGRPCRHARLAADAAVRRRHLFGQTLTNPGPFRMHVAQIDLRRPGIRFKVSPPAAIAK
jgi:hypothetical protein